MHDLFIFKHSKSKYDEYQINQKINNVSSQNPKKANASDIEYYQRLADPLVTEPFSKIFDITDNQVICNDDLNAQMNNQANALHNAITVEKSLHNQKPSCVLLYRGNGSENDFNPDDAYDVAKRKANNQYLQKMSCSFYWGIPLTLSYGLYLLSNAKKLTGECPYVYAFRPNVSYEHEPEQYKNHGDLQLLPVEKKDFNKQSGLWYINPDYDYFNSVHANEVYFHPRAKGHSTEEICEKASEFNNQFDLKDGLRYTVHKTQKEAFKKLKKLKKYQINNAIGATDYTKYKIQEAQKAYQKGKVKK